MLVMSRIAARASNTSFQDTRPAHAKPAKMAASDSLSTSVSSRRPASDSRPYIRAMPPSIPSSTCPNAMSPRPQPRRPAATAAPAATLKASVAHVTSAGESPSATWQKRSSGRIARSAVRPTAGAKSNIRPPPVDQHVEHQQDAEDGDFLDLVGNAGEPAACDPWRVWVERHLLKADAVIHRHVDREEDDRHDAAEEHPERNDPEQRDRFLER